MENFLRIKKELMKLIKDESIVLILLIISNIFRNNQLAFKNHLEGEL